MNTKISSQKTTKLCFYVKTGLTMEYYTHLKKATIENS